MEGTYPARGAGPPQAADGARGDAGTESADGQVFSDPTAAPQRSLEGDDGAGAAPVRVGEQITRSRRDLLDLTFRNPLLSYRPLRAKGVRIVDEVPREVFRLLVEKRQAMYFLAAPEARRDDVEPPGPPSRAGAQAGHGDGIRWAGDGADAADSAGAGPGAAEMPAELVELMAQSAPGEVQERHLDNKLQTAHSAVRMETRLRNTLRHARSSMEEQGVNILYLALGALAWHESDSSERVRRAPLLLLPVKLDQSSLGGRFKMRWTEEEIDANLSLDAKLKQDFGIRLPELEEGEGETERDGFGVDDYFAKVEQAVARKPRWKVDRTAVDLGFFSFSKLLIYKDLDPAAWPEDQQPADHPLVRSLFGAGAEEPPPSIEDAGPGQEGGAWLDDRLGVGDTHQVVDADSSQTLAVMDAVAGRNLVVQGPPGTGKSQTIANLIAECVARDRTVLFVAEKMAALQVVKRRLDHVGVGDAALELHSHTSNKAAVLAELRRTLELGKPELEDAAADRFELERSRERLNAYAAAVNAPVGRSKLTPQQLVGRLAPLGGAEARPDAPALDLPDAGAWSREDFVERRAEVRDLQALVAARGVPRENPHWGSARVRVMPADQAAVAGALETAAQALARHWDDAKRLRGVLGLDAAGQPALGPDEVVVLLATAATAAEAPSLAGVRRDAPEWTRRAPEIEVLAAAALAFAGLRDARDAVLIPSAWEADALAARRDLAALGGKWRRFLSPAWRRASRELRGLCRGDPPAGHREQVALLDAILEARRLRDRLSRSSELVARLFAGPVQGWEAAPWRRIGEVAPWLLRLRREIEEGTVHACLRDVLDPESPSDLEGLRAAAEDCGQSQEALAEALDQVSRALELDESRFAPGPPPRRRSFSELDGWLGRAKAGLDSLQDMARFNQIARRLAALDVEGVARAAASWPGAGQELVHLFEHDVCSAWLEAAWKERPVLAEFDGPVHEGVVQQFRDLDRSMFAHNRRVVALRHWERMPRGHGAGQLGLLRREFQKKRRHLPLRRLVKSAGNAIQTIKPVFMMSPLSIAKFVPPGSIEFDLVIFDEASQVRPMDAMGAVVRAKQAVVVGDSKQLPPTAFFDRIADDEEELSQTADLESVLGLFCSRGVPERMLRWHYRSRHESLIAVSNREFYDSRLVVFPSPDKGREDTGLRLCHDPSAFYGRGTNPDEARRVAEAVMRHAAERPHQTLGVAAFSLQQARRIEDELEILRRRDPSAEEFFRRHPEEPFFVKNLENVQGDEREAIFISVGYGKVDGGRMSMRFGPLNADGGERRLNVLITRARSRCVVFCNFHAEDLDLRRTGARGVRALKTFLEYARTGRLDMPAASGRDADSPFEQAVADELRSRGHEVAHQVGSVGFFVDLAVIDPARPGRYLLGIECDGATYHSARSARDRDRLRQQVLEGLGWRIHRIWSTDWFRNRDREMARVEKAIRLAAEHAREARPAIVGDGTERKPSEAPPAREAAPGSAAGTADSPGAAVSDDGGSSGRGEGVSSRAAAGRGLADGELANAAPASVGGGGVRRAAPTDHDHEVPDTAVPYRLADLGACPAGFDLSSAGPWRLAGKLAEVVAVESPVHVREAATRLARWAGLKRTGSRIVRDVEQSARQAAKRELVVRRGEFLWRPGHEDAVVRRRDEVEGSLHEFDRIAPEEIAAALLHAARVSYGIQPDDILSEAARLFGFRALTSKRKAAVIPVRDALAEAGVLVRRDGFLYLAERLA